MSKLQTLKSTLPVLGNRRVQTMQAGSWRTSDQMAAQRGYGYKWQKAREQFLRAHPLCLTCQVQGRVEAATVVDHSTPHRGDQSLFLRRSNWQPLCAMAGFQKGLTDALANFQATGQRNQAPQQDLDRSLRELRTATAGMRGDFVGLPERIAVAAQPAFAQYASTCTAVLQELADRGGRMAERGADIARAADERLMATPLTPR
ncbi:hypothetical protein [Delftia acidovorans]|uniref:hypothetical protein n=1 Tax=Delftia acidovorans TaxID=80866 RepID=UPI000BCAFD16|nr:hypothetical protein [Delftia acidovorans]SOE36633.1 hypothetical protein SAMN05216519_2655 [Delftia acidovorans]